MATLLLNARIRSESSPDTQSHSETSGTLTKNQAIHERFTFHETFPIHETFTVLSKQKSPPNSAGFLMDFAVLENCCFAQRLTLRELCSAACTTKTVLFALLHTRVACEEPVISEGWEILFAEADQGTSNTHSDRTGLAHRTATSNSNEHINLISLTNVVERLHDQTSFCIGHEVLFELAIIDRNLSSAWADSHPSDAGFTTPRSKAVTVDFVFLREHQFGSRYRFDELV